MESACKSSVPIRPITCRQYDFLNLPIKMIVEITSVELKAEMVAKTRTTTLMVNCSSELQLSMVEAAPKARKLRVVPLNWP